MATISLGDALRAGAEITMTVEPRPPTPPPPEPEPACRWEAMWKRGLEPGDAFDVGGVSGALASYLKRAPRPPEGSAALVPGCGRAYDALALARLRDRRVEVVLVVGHGDAADVDGDRLDDRRRRGETLEVEGVE